MPVPLVALLVALLTTTQSATTATQPARLQKPIAVMAAAGADAGIAKPLRVLFIGNSYTYFHNLPELVQGLAAGMTPARRVEIGRVTVGGATLMMHWKDGNALRQLRGSPWDIVVLQEQSTLGSSGTAPDGQALITDPHHTFWPGVRLFDAEIKKAGAKTVLLQTWARRASPANTDSLEYAYVTIGRELNATVIPAGRAWQRALKERSTLTLYEPDGSHPAPAGSYLTAMIVLSALLGVEPQQLPLRVSGHAIGGEGDPLGRTETLAEIDAQTFALFRRVAWSTWTDASRAGGYLPVTQPAVWTNQREGARP